MSQTPKEAFTRVVAIAVQSLMNRHPKRAPGALNVHALIHLSAWDWDDSQMGLSLSVTGYPRPGIELLDFIPSGDRDPEERASSYLWIDHTKLTFRRRVVYSQDAVEKMYATAFTYPYPVTRVTDTALKLAQDLVEMNVSSAFPWD